MTQQFKKILLAGMFITVSAPALAQSADTQTANGFGEFSGTVGIYSDYRFRGVSQTDKDPAIQGSIDWEHDSGFYAGVWGSNVDFNDGDEAHIELDVYGGYTFEMAGLDMDVGLVGYLYPGADSSLDYNYYELKLAASKDLEWASFGANIYYSPEYFADSGDAVYAGINASAPIMETGLGLSASYGYQWIDDEVTYGTPDYADWSVGLGYNWNGFDFNISYVDTDLSKAECPDLCDATAVFSVSRSF